MYCIDYSTKFKHFDDERVTEVLVKCDGTLSTMQGLCDTMEQKKTMVLDLFNGFDIICTRNLIELKKFFRNFKALIPVGEDRLRPFLNQHNDLIKLLQENEVPFFFNVYVSDWETLHLLADVGVTDMYIVENLCFELDKVHKVLSEKNIQVRVFPNVAQSKYKYDVISFFIRPEDKYIYDEYVNIYEFYDRPNVYTMNTYFDVYANNEKWGGNLNELIIGLEDTLDSRFTIPRFGETRVRCGKRCLKGESCQMCHRIVSLSNTLESAGLVVQREIENL